LDAHYEPAFTLADEHSLFVDGGDNADGAADFLAHAIARNPVDLRCHVQRIFLLRQQRQPAALAGALLDLFISLGSRGRPLRERLLNASVASLDPASAGFLRERLSSGLSATSALPDEADAMLAAGIRGDTPVVVNGVSAAGQPEKSALDRDYLAEAQSFIEYGQLDLARKSLETGVTLLPEQRQMHQDLLELYQHTDDRDGFRRTQQRLNDMNNPFAELWQEQIVFSRREADGD